MNIREEKNTKLLLGLYLLSITMSLKEKNPGGKILKLYDGICNAILAETTGHVNNKKINEKFMDFLEKKRV